ncbi:unnamed protein product [Calicophoron daubneyi]|uniref:EF-hand domain-containing protein n=1 Tax=Calicophoron daubneyi TaxID=300641 RepID=A0AAV2T402_CALDB
METVVGDADVIEEAQVETSVVQETDESVQEGPVAISVDLENVEDNRLTEEQPRQTLIESTGCDIEDFADQDKRQSLVLASSWMDAKLDTYRARSRLWHGPTTYSSGEMSEELGEDTVEEMCTLDESNLELDTDSETDLDFNEADALNVEEPVGVTRKVIWNRPASLKRLPKEKEGNANGPDEGVEGSKTQRFSRWPNEMPTEYQLCHDTIGKAHYIQACIMADVTPVRAILNQLGHKTLNLKHRCLGPSGIGLLSKGIERNATITWMDLSGNSMGAGGAMALAKGLKENTFVKTLLIRDNHLRKKGLEQLYSSLARHTTVKELDLSGNELGNASCGLIAELISSNRVLVSLDISRNGIGSDGAEEFGDAIGSNDTMEQLNISWNSIMGDGAIAVAHGLKENIHLKSCDLSWNAYSGKAAIELARAIRENERLIDLSVRGNRIQDEAGEAFGQALYMGSNGDSRLQTLDLSRNSISTKGVLRLLMQLARMETTPLKMVMLEDIPVDFNCVQLIRTMTGTLPDLQIVHRLQLINGNTRDDIKVDSGKFADLFSLLRDGIRYRSRRLVDILQQLDTEQTKCVTREQFVEALDRLAVNYKRSQIEEVASRLDKLKDGTIYFGNMSNNRSYCANVFEASIGDHTNMIMKSLSQSFPFSSGACRLKVSMMAHM